MKIVVNGEERALEPETTAAALVPAGRRGVAIVVDGEHVPQSKWLATTLRDGQRVELLEPHAGG